MTEESFNMEKAVRLSVESDIAFLSLGGPEEKTVILDAERMAGLKEAVLAVQRRSDLKGLVICGPNENCFCAGADINVIRSVESVPQGEALAREGQTVFQLIDDLPIPTVAAICGPCIGGGFEMALACDYRIAANTSRTKIGLPETKLGIIPGFGGCQRLPRLLGLGNALDIILKGSVLPAAVAMKKGMVDLLVPVEDDIDSVVLLRQTAIQLIQGKRELRKPQSSLRDTLLSKTSLGRMLVARQARQQILGRTNGFYPALLAAIDVCARGLGMSLSDGLALEARMLGEMIVTRECKSLVHVYFLTEAASKLGKIAGDSLAGLRVGVVGGGVMGAGIAAVHLMQGIPVVLVDINSDVRMRAQKHIETSLSRQRGMGDAAKSDALKKLQLAADLSALADCGLVIEAIPENIELKKKVLGDIAAVVASDAIICSNTSSLSVTEIASVVPRSERVIGMHFFNPAEKMPLVEIICASQTGERAIALTAGLSARLGKYPIVVEDVPGFLVNRVLSPYLMEAAHLLGEGVPVELIDKAATSFGMPMGPLRLLDEIGLDVAAKVASVVAGAYGERMEGPRFAESLASKGILGRKSGKGFYVYSQTGDKVNHELAMLLGITASRRNVSSAEVSERLVLPMLNEAVRVLDEGVAGAPGRDAAGQIDLGSVMGTGFAPFRGGLIQYAETIGAKQLVEKFMHYESQYGMRYAPAPGIVARASLGISFYESVKLDS
ncbi:MAG: 3-hydroxyacyl-CoA dehydrogenase NAD-binding domain-containing protein [bacterium]|nr:3-hydroxyacyl-CoA dehydrogenase NAD-binding domain-containing protein [bacterium]